MKEITQISVKYKTIIKHVYLKIIIYIRDDINIKMKKEILSALNKMNKILFLRKHKLWNM